MKRNKKYSFSRFLRFHKNKEGLTLAEVLVSALIFSATIMGMLAGYISFMVLNEHSRNEARAIYYARQELEENISRDFHPPSFDRIWPAEHPSDGNENFLIQTAITQTESNTNLLDIRAAVCWRDQRGRLIGEIAEGPQGIYWERDLGNNDEYMDCPVVLECSYRP